MKVYGRITTFLIILLFSFTLHAQVTNLHRIYFIPEGYLILDTVVIDMKEIGFNENSVIIMEEPGVSNSDTGYIAIDRWSKEEDVMAFGKIVETNKTMYLYRLDELDPESEVIKSPEPVNVTAYEYSFLGFGNHETLEVAIILREYLEGSLETRGKKWYFFKILFIERENESMQLYGYQEPYQ